MLGTANDLRNDAQPPLVKSRCTTVLAFSRNLNTRDRIGSTVDTQPVLRRYGMIIRNHLVGDGADE